MILESWNTDMGLHRHPSAANQQLDTTLLCIVQYSDERIDRGVFVEADRHVETCLFEFLESTDVRIFQRNSVVSHDGYLSNSMKSREQQQRNHAHITLKSADDVSPIILVQLFRIDVFSFFYDVQYGSYPVLRLVSFNGYSTIFVVGYFNHRCVVCCYYGTST